MLLLIVQIKQISNFHPLEVVGRGSETQLRVGEHLNLKLIKWDSRWDIFEMINIHLKPYRGIIQVIELKEFLQAFSTLQTEPISE